MDPTTMRPLSRWTKDEPTASGYWWTRVVDADDGPTTAKIIEIRARINWIDREVESREFRIPFRSPDWHPFELLRSRTRRKRREFSLLPITPPAQYDSYTSIMEFPRSEQLMIDNRVYRVAFERDKYVRGHGRAYVRTFVCEETRHRFDVYLHYPVCRAGDFWTLSSADDTQSILAN